MACDHRVNIIGRNAAIVQKTLQPRGALSFLRCLSRLKSIEPRNGPLSFGGNQGRHRRFGACHLLRMPHITSASQQRIIRGRHLVVAPHEGIAAFGKPQRHDGLVERLFKRKRLVGERRIGPMTMRADGDERTDGVVGRLHEMRWAQQVFAFATQRLQKFLRTLHASQSGAAEDGIGTRRSALLQCRLLRYAPRRFASSRRRADVGWKSVPVLLYI